MPTLGRQEVLWLSRLQTQTAISDPAGQRQSLLALLEAPPTASVEHAVRLGAEQQGPARLFAGRVPQDVAEARRCRMREAAQKKGRQVSKTRLALAA